MTEQEAGGLLRMRMATKYARLLENLKIRSFVSFYKICSISFDIQGYFIASLKHRPYMKGI